MTIQRVTAATVFLAIAAGALGCGPTAVAPAAAPRVFDAQPAAPVAPRDARSGAQPSKRTVDDLSRQFLTAYLRWEVERATPADVRTLLKSSSAAVAAANFSAPPREPSASKIPPQARLVSITVPVSRESESPGAVAVTVRLLRRGHHEQMSLVIALQGDRARVTDLSPPSGA